MPVPRMGGMDDVGGPQDWFMSLPIMTRYWFGGTCALTFIANVGVISPYLLVWQWVSVKNNFEIWRLVSSFCYAGGFSLNMLITLYIQVTFSQMYEKGAFNTGAGGGTADYAFMLLFGMAVTLLTFPLLGGTFGISPVFTQNLIYFVMYAWSKRNPTAQANIWGVPIKGMYLPFAYLALTVATGGSPYNMLHGMAAGHIYYFLVDVVPTVQGKHYLKTPQFLIDFFGVGEYRPEPVAQQPQRFGRIGGGGQAPQQQQAAQQQPRGHQWGGGGQRLGTQ